MFDDEGFQPLLMSDPQVSGVWLLWLRVLLSLNHAWGLGLDSARIRHRFAEDVAVGAKFNFLLPRQETLFALSSLNLVGHGRGAVAGFPDTHPKGPNPDSLSLLHPKPWHPVMRAPQTLTPCRLPYTHPKP